MKRLLSIIGAISLVGTSTTSLISCSPKHENTITGNLMLIWPEQGYFNKVDNKWYVAIVRGDSSGWHVIKFNNDGKASDRFSKNKKIPVTDIYRIELNYENNEDYGLYIVINGKGNNREQMWGNKGSEKYFKNVYQWIWDDEPNDDQLPEIDSEGNIKK